MGDCEVIFIGVFSYATLGAILILLIGLCRPQIEWNVLQHDIPCIPVHNLYAYKRMRMVMGAKLILPGNG